MRRSRATSGPGWALYRLGRIDDGDDDATALEVLTRTRVALARRVEQPRLERSSLLQVADLQGDAESVGTSDCDCFWFMSVFLSLGICVAAGARW